MTLKTYCKTVILIKLLHLSREDHRFLSPGPPGASWVPLGASWVPKWLPNDSQNNPWCFQESSQMLPRCLLHASSSMIAPPWFLLNIFFSMIILPMIPPQCFLLYDSSSNDSSSMILWHWLLSPNSSSWSKIKTQFGVWRWGHLFVVSTVITSY